MDLSVIVPCYNEAANLPRLFEAFRKAFQKTSANAELLLVDNGSKDHTPQVLTELINRPEYWFARSVRVDVNQGYGYGILYGLRHGVGEYLGWTHADMQTPPGDTLCAFEMIQSMSDPANSIARGLRKGRPWFDTLFTSGMGWLASAALGSRLYDVNAQPKVFHRSMMDYMHNAPHDFTLDLYLLHLANQRGMEVGTFEVRFDQRKAGEAKGGGTLKGKYKLIKRTLVQIYQLRRSLREKPVSIPIPFERAVPSKRKAA